jgi:hypothetical protein
VPGADDLWRTPPTDDPNARPIVPYLLPPNTPCGELSPRARAALEAVDRETMAYLEAHPKEMPSEERLLGKRH